MIRERHERNIPGGGFSALPRRREELKNKKAVLHRRQSREMEVRPSLPAGRSVFKLSQAGVSWHVIYSLAAAACITAAARPQNAYVGLRTLVAAYGFTLCTSLIMAHFTRGTIAILGVAAFVLLNQYLTWALIGQFDDNTTDLAVFIARIIRGWFVAIVAARVVLPMGE